MWWVLLCALLAVGLTPVQAQTGTVTGTVRDPQGTALAGASIVVKGTVLGAATSPDGGFQVRNIPVGTRELVVSMVGYRRMIAPVEIVAGTVARVDIVLVEAAIQSGEVVITAGRRPQSLEEVPVSMAIVDGRDIERRNQVSLDDALRYIPGVNMTESQVNIRGSSGYSRAFGTRVLILVDGIPQLSGDAGEIKYDAIPMFTIDRIEVVKGAGSALYGSSALGGVINVITREPERRMTRARVSAGFYEQPWYPEWRWWGSGVQAFGGVDVQHADRLGAFSYMLTGGFHRNAGYRQNDDYTRWNLNGKARHRIDGQSDLGVFATYASDNRGNWIYWRGLDSALIPPSSADLTEHIVSTKFQTGAHYRRTVSPSFSWSARGHLYRTAYDTHSDSSTYEFRPNDRTQSSANAWGLEVQGSWAPHATDMLVFGVDGTYSTVDARTYGRKAGYSGAVYVQNEWTVQPGLTLSTGARFDLTRVDSLESASQFNPRAGIAWSMFEGTTLRASVGRGFRSPSIAERFVQASGGTIRTKPNPALRSESSVSYEAGVKQMLPFGTMLDVAGFWSDYENLVEPTIDPADGMVRFENITRARIRGVEIGVMGSLFHGLFEYSAGYTWMEPKDPRTDSTLKYRPRHLLFATAGVQHAGVSLTADYRYVSRIDAIDDAAGLLIRNADIRVATQVVDLRLSWDLASIAIPLVATFSVDNLLQYHYSEIIGNIAPIRHYTLTLQWQN